MKRRSAGFTLIEILIVLAVAGIILVILGQGLRLGIRGTDSFRHAIRAQSDMVPVERALRAMIERMDPGLYPEPPDVHGTAHALAFTTELPDAATGGTLTADVRLEAAGGRLVLWWTPHAMGVPFGPPPPPQHEVLLDRVERLDIGYAAKGAGASWRSSWAEQTLPGLIRLVVVPAASGESWPPIIARPPREQAEE